MIKLITICRKAYLYQCLENIYKSSKSNITTGLETLEAIESQLNLLGKYRDFHNANYLIGFVTFLESYINDTFKNILYTFPGKLENKTFKLEQLDDLGAVSQILSHESDKQLNELTYKSFIDIVEISEKKFGVKNLDKKLIEELNEIKCTRDIYVHASGYANNTYLKKVGEYKRANPGEKLIVDIHYVRKAIELIAAFVDKLNESFVGKYKKCKPSFVLKEMWEESTLNEKLSFDKAWNMEGEEVWPKEFYEELVSPYKELYFFFLHIGGYNMGFDLLATMSLWPDGTKERAMINSWIDFQFHASGPGAYQPHPSFLKELLAK